MKEIKKLALILRSLGITAKVVDNEPIIDGDGEIIDDNVYLVCDYGFVHFDVWYYEEEDTYELHYTFGDELIYDSVCLKLMESVNEITNKCILPTLGFK